MNVKPNADKKINKIIACHNKNLGCSVYFCEECKEYTFIGHTCKSRFYTSCGYKYKFRAPIEAVEEFEQDDELSGLPISTPPYTICSQCNYDKCVPLDYKSKRGYHHIYKEN